MSSQAAKANGASQYPSINIVGAGIAGLSLACYLRRRCIPFNIFDAASKPKGHNYGITLAPWGYVDRLSAVGPNIDRSKFLELTAVDRIVGGQGVTARSSSNKHDLDVRVSDMALRELLARGHQVNWNHKVVSAETVQDGLKLNFENGKVSTATITIDAGGERSVLPSVLSLPELSPEILPYAVYHGSRYIPSSTFVKEFEGIFEDEENVKNFPPPSRQGQDQAPWHLQVARSYVKKDQLSSKINLNVEGDEPIIEFRYTFSRPARTAEPDSDPLFKPSRGRDEAKHTPPALFDELSSYLASNTSIPQSLQSQLSPSNIKAHNDRILNWLMRLKPLHEQRLRDLAGRGVISIGDSVHSTPPLQSEGASYAMDDSRNVVDWIEREWTGAADGEGGLEEKVMRFYRQRLRVWEKAREEAKGKLQEMHTYQRSGEGQVGQLSGRI